MNVLFWNLKGKELGSIVIEIVREQSIDLLVLAEASGISNTELVEKVSLQADGPYHFHFSPGQNRLRIFSRFPPLSIVNLEDSSGIAVRRVTIPGCLPLIMVAAHLPSQLYWSRSEDRMVLFRRLRESLESAELSEKHKRSFLVGDFNSDPFSEELINSEGLHAVMSRRVAARTSRRVNDEERFYLYNPMWTILGDNPDPPGSYYHRRSIPSCRFWHLFDQVLLRPELQNAFDFSKLQIVTHVGDRSLLTKAGQPNFKRYSDHLPIVFSFDLIGSFVDEG